jgi:hypothetical protein
MARKAKADDTQIGSDTYKRGTQPDSGDRSRGVSQGSGTARATQRNPLLKKKKKKERRGGGGRGGWKEKGNTAWSLSGFWGVFGFVLFFFNFFFFTLKCYRTFYL